VGSNRSGGCRFATNVLQSYGSLLLLPVVFVAVTDLAFLDKIRCFHDKLAFQLVMAALFCFFIIIFMGPAGAPAVAGTDVEQQLQNPSQHGGPQPQVAEVQASSTAENPASSLPGSTLAPTNTATSPVLEPQTEPAHQKLSHNDDLLGLDLGAPPMPLSTDGDPLLGLVISTVLDSVVDPAATVNAPFTDNQIHTKDPHRWWECDREN
jgi:hypothetical protein